MKRRILLIPHYFYPDVASTAQIITELTEELQQDFDITVISAFPSYTGEIPEEYRKKFIVKEKYQDVEIYRVRVPELNKAKKINRIKGMVSYFIFSVVAIFMCGKQDIVFCMSQPPIVGGILGTIA
ncbi:MAG: glycosyltransferase WbuB, partial [Clostridiaceae bacterium]|nr:glycosyltransferase WbuB [Clostridiaceae bacterium]